MNTHFTDAPISDTQMKLIIQGMESEQAEIKNLAIQTLEQAKKTNGRVNKHDHLLWLANGALIILAPIAGWLVITVVSLLKQPQYTPEQMQAAGYAGMQQAIRDANN